MEITGTIIEIKETKQVSEKFKTRELIVKTDENYPQYILLQATQDKCGLLDKYKVNSSVKCSINLKGRRWENNLTGEIKYFNSIEVWKIEQTSEVNINSENKQDEGVKNDTLPF